MRTHEECRKSVCVICMGKTKNMQNITDCLSKIIKNDFLPHFDLNNINFPLAICGTCRLAITKNKNHSKNGIKMFDYAIFKPARAQTRNSATCTCTICEVAQAKAVNISGAAAKNKRGRPRTISKKPIKVSICSKCLTSIKRGCKHVCKNSERVDNIKKLSGSPKTLEKVTSSVILEKIDKNENVCLARPSGGHPLKIAVQSVSHLSRKTNDSIVSVDFMSSLRSSLDISSNHALKLASQLRNTLGPNLVEPVSKLKSFMNEKSHVFDNFFKYETVEFTVKSGNSLTTTTEVMVYCHDLSNFISEIVKHRCYSDDVELQLKVGLDSGGQYLKICLNIHELQNSNRTNKLKDTNVKKLFIIAIADRYS